MTDLTQTNKTLVLTAFDALFNQRDYAAAARYWSPDYLQHSSHITAGRDGLFDLVRAAPPEHHWEPGIVVAEGDYVMVHSRFSGRGEPTNWVAVDIVRVTDGRLAEHWDVIEDEATRAQSRSGLPMFGTVFPGE